MRRPGDKRETAKFSDQEVLEIRRAVRQRGVSQAEAARVWGCSPDTIYAIVTRAHYKWVAEDFYWPYWECVPGLGPDWLRERMEANALKAQRDRNAGKQRRKPKMV